MAQDHNMGEGYSTDALSKSLYEVEGDMDVHGNNSMSGRALKTKLSMEAISTPSTTTGIQFPPSFGIQLQEMVMHAFIQSIAALIGPSSGLLPTMQGASIGTPLLSTQGLHIESMWKEATYNKSVA